MLNYSFFSTQTSLWRRHTLIKHVRSCFFSQGKDGTASDCIMKNKSHARVLYRSRSIDSSRTNRTNPKISRAKLVKVYLVAYIDNVMLAERRIVTDALEQTTRRNDRERRWCSVPSLKDETCVSQLKVRLANMADRT